MSNYKMDKSMVIYHNHMNNVTFKDFGAVELNVFFSICSMIRDKGSEHIEIPFHTIKEVSDTKFKSNKELVDKLMDTNNKLLNLKMTMVKESSIIQFVLFTKFEISLDKQCLFVRVNDEFGYILNELTKNFTSFELKMFTGLKSKYAKHLYRLLMQYKSTGYYRVSIEEFRRLLDIPASYEMKKVSSYVLKTIIDELSPYFPNFKVNKIRKGATIGFLEFTFDKLTKEKVAVVEEMPKLDAVMMSKSMKEMELLKEKLIHLAHRYTNIFWVSKIDTIKQQFMYRIQENITDDYGYESPFRVLPLTEKNIKQVSEQLKKIEEGK